MEGGEVISFLQRSSRPKKGGVACFFIIYYKKKKLGMTAYARASPCKFIINKITEAAFFFI